MKRWVPALFAIMLAIGLSACGNNSNDSEGAASSSAAGSPASASAGEAGVKGSISFAYWGAQTEADAINKVVDDFKAKYPDIKVESQWIQSDYLTKVQTMIAGGTAPDVMLISNSDLPGFADAFQEAQLDPNAFSSPTLVDAMTYNGKVYASPFIIKPKVMAINVDLFEKNNIPLPSATEPMTAEQFGEISKKLTSGEGKSKVFGSEPLWMGNWIYSFGGTYYSEDGKKSTIASPESMAAANFIIRAKQDGTVPNDTEKQGQSMMDWFLSGRIGMFTDFGPWYLPQMADVKSFKWDLVPFPGNGGAKEVDGLAVSKSSKNAEAAKLFVKHLTEDQAAQEIIGGNKSAYGIPVVKSAAGAFETIYPDKNMQAFIYSAENQHASETQKRTNEINNELKMIDDLTPVGIGNHKVEEVFPKVAANIDKILQQD